MRPCAVAHPARNRLRQRPGRARVPASAVSWLAIVATLGGLASGCGGESDSVADGGAPARNGRAAISFEPRPGLIRVMLGGEAFTGLHFGEEWDKPFLYPLRTVSGTVVSRGYPVEPRDGEERDHDWHRGIWYGHGDINGHDFWRELGRDRSGTIVPLSEPVFEAGDRSGWIEVELGFRNASGGLEGSLVQRYAFERVERSFRIDARLTFKADQGRDLRFGDTEDGGFAMRLSDGFRQDRGAVLRNAEGLTDTENIWGKASRWVDYATAPGDAQAGVAILDHPSNPRHPSRWHARGYSLCSANPFGLRDFTGADDADGSYVVPQGETRTFRYRIVIHEGAASLETIEAWFGDFAAS